MLRAETSERLQKLVDHASTHDLTVEEREPGDWGGLYAPNAGALAREVVRSWCRLCTAYSPYSEGQNRLVEFLEQLRDLPRWMAPVSRPDENGHVHRSEFRVLRFDWIGLEEEFRRQHFGRWLCSCCRGRTSSLIYRMRSIQVHVLPISHANPSEQTSSHTMIVTLPPTPGGETSSTPWRASQPAG